MRLYIHIGYPKTGTSAIQSHVFCNQGWLEERGLFIPSTGYASGLGHAFLVSRQQVLGTAPESGKKTRTRANVEMLAKELKDAEAAGFTRALLTWEGFSLAGSDVLDVLAKALGRHEVVVLAYVRDQLTLYQAAALQQLKMMVRVSPATFFDEGNVPGIVMERYDFTAGLNRWRVAFGENLQIRVRLYKRTRLRNENVVSDFLDWLDLEMDERFALEKRQINSSPGHRAAALLLVSHAAGMASNDMLRLSRSLSQMGTTSGPRHFLRQSDIHLIRESFAESNRRLFEQFRPENALPEETELELPGERHEESESDEVFSFLRDVYLHLQHPTQEIWDGRLLSGRHVSRLTTVPGRGWRAPESTGTWSSGRKSEIAFLTPATDPESGPIAIELSVTGLYFGSNTLTRVTLNGSVQCLDLRSASMTVALDDRTRAEGVLMLLEHQRPLSPASNNSESEDGIAFKLQSIFYTFLWPRRPLRG